MHLRQVMAGIAAGCVSQTFAASPKWELVKSVPHPTGGTQDFVVVPEEKQRDREYYRHIAEKVCGARATCMVFFWTKRESVPSSSRFHGNAMQALTGQYERHANYQEPHLRLACWLYPSKEAGEKAKCFYMPGAQVPPAK